MFLGILGPGVWEVLRLVRELVLSCTFDSVPGRVALIWPF